MFTHSFGIWVNQYCNSDLTNWDMFILLTETRFLTFIKREKALKIPTGWKFNYIVVFEQFIRLFICPTTSRFKNTAERQSKKIMNASKQKCFGI